jgi:hypothetical protein
VEPAASYQGAVGQTRRQPVHVTDHDGALITVEVVVAVNTRTDRELGEALRRGQLNTVTLADGRVLAVTTPVLYHDPDAGLLVLVLAATDRQRELEVRVAHLQALAADPAPIPRYAVDVEVAFGADDLDRCLQRARRRAGEAQQLAEWGRELERARSAGLSRAGELDERARMLDARAAELERRERALAGAPAPVAPAAAIAEPAAVSRSGAAVPVSADFEEVTNPIALAEPTVVGVSIPMITLPAGADPVTTTWDDRAIDAGAPGRGLSADADWAFTIDGGVVQLAVRLDRLGAGADSPLVRGAVDVHLTLWRHGSYPLIVLALAPPAAIRVGELASCVLLGLDVAAEPDRAALAALARDFVLVVDLVVGAGCVRRVRLTAPLADNVSYLLRAAEDHLRTLHAEGGAPPSAPAARAALRAPGADVLGLGHDDAGEFRDDKLSQLDTTSQVRRALACARRYARPMREDYLVCVRGYPLVRWRALRRQVVARAVEMGLWLGPELAQVAVSEGMARSRRDLITRLLAGFEAARDQAWFDLDGDAADDNLGELREEARALGVDAPSARTRPVVSADAPSAAGTIERPERIAGRPATADAARAAEAAKARPLEELLARLEGRTERLDAAIALCERADARALGPVMAAVRKMSRAEAVRVLGMMVRFGAPATPVLMEGLASSKAYLRHGCALALAMLRNEAGTEAVIDLLLSEPTEIWREVARAVGQVGPSALMPLATQLGRMGDRATASARERVAWAMAHVAVRGGRPAVEAMAAGASVVAPVAANALELLSSAARDEVRVRRSAGGSSPGREVTVNRAFSRRFFEALERDQPELAQAELAAMDTSEPMELLDESDLIADDEPGDDGVDEVDDSDIIAS